MKYLKNNFPSNPACKPACRTGRLCVGRTIPFTSTCLSGRQVVILSGAQSRTCGKETPCINTGVSTRGFLAALGMIPHIKIMCGIIYLLSAANSFAQQDALYSQYLFNPLALNPAFAGSKGVLSAVLLHRSQWLGFDGAPTTQSFSIHSPLYVKGHTTLIHESTIKKGKSQFWKKIGLGLNIVNDKIGPNNNLGVFGSYAYRLPLGSGTLAMGLRAGVLRYRIDWNEIDYSITEPDRNGTSRVFIPGFDFGLHYYTPDFFLGTALSNLSKPKIAVDESGNRIEAQLYRHLMVNSGVAMKINKNIIFQPSFVFRYVRNSPLDFDINTNFLFYDKFWLGTGFRLGYGMVFLTQYYITDKFKVGYAYDTSFNKIKSAVGGSHEILIGYDFAKKNHENRPLF